MKIKKLAKLLIAIQVGLASSVVIAESSTKNNTADKNYSPYASSTMPVNVY